MIAYAGNTRTRRNLLALKEHDWRIFLSPENPNPPEGFRFAIDNGCWPAYTRNMPWDDKPFSRLFEIHGGAADFTVLPDIVAGGYRSLELSLKWFPRLGYCRHLLLPVQDGMELRQVGIVLEEHLKIGIFLGGSTEWKLRTMYGWGMLAAALGRWYHVGRVNSARRIRLAAEAGASSFDGTSATRYSRNAAPLDKARQQPSLLTPTLLGANA
jgi:hypothetical protein